ncbi:MAG: 3-isopropylmalate dehydratase small subunit [Desulfobacteraceae bacterium]|nr:3-isopropylmalate dehydratase small subunit [Desulfobacteraceae bacterium]
MESFTTHTGIVATLDRSNVDTDQIIPKQFLKSILRVGYGPSAFFDWRYDREGNPLPDFELNSPRFQGRSILVTGNNFGCGSSREHAVWALLQDGYRAVIAPFKMRNDERIPGFADIFKSNAVKNGLLTIELSETAVSRIVSLVADVDKLQATIDLPGQRITIHAAEPVAFSFDIDGASKDRLINGLDDIAVSLKYEIDIRRFEEQYDLFLSPQA